MSTPRGHNDRDYACVYWWGDRSGSTVGVANEYCLICHGDAPPPARPLVPRGLLLALGWVTVVVTLTALIVLITAR